MKGARVALTAMFTALSTASAYATSTLPNVSLMDVVVFIAGWTLGARGGALVGALSWCIYGLINPYGFNPAVWMATITMEPFYGVAGGFARKVLELEDGVKLKHLLFLGAIGFIITFIYDVATNVIYAYAFNVPLLIALALGAPFALLHEGSNLILFTSIAPPAMKAIDKFTKPLEVIKLEAK